MSADTQALLELRQTINGMVAKGYLPKANKQLIDNSSGNIASRVLYGDEVPFRSDKPITELGMVSRNALTNRF